MFGYWNNINVDFNSYNIGLATPDAGLSPYSSVDSASSFSAVLRTAEQYGYGISICQYHNFTQ